MWLTESDPALTIVSHDVPSGWVQFAAGQTQQYTVQTSVSGSANGTFTHGFSLRSDGQGVCETDGIVYVIPIDEDSISKGWHPSSPVVHKFRAQVLPTTASWEGVQVREYFVDSEGRDDCWDEGGFFEEPQVSPNANAVGDPFNYGENYEWIVQSNNKWGPLHSNYAPPRNTDNIGFPSFMETDPNTQVESRRAPILGWIRANQALYSEAQKTAVANGLRQNPSPHDCSMTWTQHMVGPAPALPAIGTTAAGWAEYTMNTITIEVTGTTVEITRDGESSGALVWP